jgi:hypothetical protein
MRRRNPRAGAKHHERDSRPAIGRKLVDATTEMESARCLTPLGGAVIARVEGDGWVNWSGLATLLTDVTQAFRVSIGRLLHSEGDAI